MDKVQLKNKLHKLKLALTLSGILGGNALSANAVENNKTTDTSRTQYKTEVITSLQIIPVLLDTAIVTQMHTFGNAI